MWWRTWGWAGDGAAHARPTPPKPRTPSCNARRRAPRPGGRFLLTRVRGCRPWAPCLPDASPLWVRAEEKGGMGGSARALRGSHLPSRLVFGDTHPPAEADLHLSFPRPPQPPTSHPSQLQSPGGRRFWRPDARRRVIAALPAGHRQRAATGGGRGRGGRPSRVRPGRSGGTSWPRGGERRSRLGGACGGRPAGRRPT